MSLIEFVIAAFPLLVACIILELLKRYLLKSESKSNAVFRLKILVYIVIIPGLLFTSLWTAIALIKLLPDASGYGFHLGYLFQMYIMSGIIIFIFFVYRLVKRKNMHY